MVPGRADAPDEEQDRAYAEDLDERIQRIIDAREAARATGSGGGGVMIPLSSAHEWEYPPPPRTRATELPDFGRGGAGDIHREGASGIDQSARAWPVDERASQGDQNLPPYVRVKQDDDYAQSPLDDYFCKGMDTLDLRHGNRCFGVRKMVVLRMWVALTHERESERRSGRLWT